MKGRKKESFAASASLPSPLPGFAAPARFWRRWPHRPALRRRGCAAAEIFARTLLLRWAAAARCPTRWMTDATRPCAAGRSEVKCQLLLCCSLPFTRPLSSPRAFFVLSPQIVGGYANWGRSTVNANVGAIVDSVRLCVCLCLWFAPGLVRTSCVVVNSRQAVVAIWQKWCQRAVLVCDRPRRVSRAPCNHFARDTPGNNCRCTRETKSDRAMAGSRSTWPRSCVRSGKDAIGRPPTTRAIRVAMERGAEDVGP
jgi:hypothetical protein